MSIPLSETPTVGLGQFIKESRFRVPSHQRDYSWNSEYIDQFLEDIEGAMERSEKIYFCGLMVFTKTEASPILRVLDGQQRLATTIMILSAIRNWMGGYSAYKKAETQIEERYIGDAELGHDKFEPKLILNSANNDVFKRYVIETVPVADIVKAVAQCKREDRSKTILDAALHINKWAISKAESFSTKDAGRDYLLKLVNYITDTVQVVRLVVRGDEAAYTIFETLNDRGLDLAPLDLVKNHLFSRAEKWAGGGLDDLEERWAEMMTLLDSVKADSFLRAFWASRHGVMEGRKLFGAFKKTYKDPEAAYSVSIEMRGAAERYVALTDPKDPVWSPFSEKTRTSVDALRVIGATQTHPIILAALEKFNKKEMERLLQLLEVIAVRYQLVARGRPGRIESLGGRVARDIFEGKIKTATEVFSQLRELYIPDDTFRSSFATKIERESKKARYLLARLERQSLLKAQEPYVDEMIPGAVTLEHVLPRSPGDAWKAEIDADSDLVVDCLQRLGNMCLLSDINHTLGNKSFSEKKKVFSKSRLKTTQSIANFPTWGRTAIEKRQSQMAELALTAWRFQ